MTELQQLIAEMARKAGVQDVVMQASSHPYHCKCESCLQWWVACGPEDDGDHWSFGPFTQAEYEAAGGKVPPRLPYDEFDEEDEFEDEEDGDGWDDGEKWDFAESVSWF